MRPHTTRILSIVLFVSLVVWGTFTLLYYLGVPVHGETLVSPQAQEAITAACGNENMLCRGVQTVVPLLTHTLRRWVIGTDPASGALQTAPFFWYVLLSFLAYGAYAGWQHLSRGRRTIRWSLKPWHFVALFVGSLWLLFTVLSNSTAEPGFAVRQILEPTAQVYSNVGEGGLIELQNNFNGLKERGCLATVQEGGDGVVGVYSIRQSCMQQAFLTRVLSQVLLSLLFLFELLIAGRAVLWLLGLRPRRILLEAALSVGLGAGVWIALLWLLAIMGIYSANAGWVLVIAVPVLLYRNALYWLRAFLTHRIEGELPLFHILVLLVWLLVSYLALNFLTVVRPFPIGWDDLGSYLNRARLLVSYGHIIHSMATFQWEYLTSLGFLLFGYDSVFGATASMIINWTAGLIATLVVFVMANEFLGPRRGVLAALLYYTLPLVGHFSFADMKIDNALFAMASLGVLALFIGLFPPEHEEGEDPDRAADAPPVVAGFKLSENWKWLFLAGLFSGLAFGIKPTAIMVLMAMIAVLFAVLLHWSAFLAAVLLAFGAFSFQGVFNIQDVYSRVTGGGVIGVSGKAFMLVCMALAAVVVVASVRRIGALRRFAAALGIVLGAFILTVLPWNTYNSLRAGSVSLRLETGMPNTLTPSISWEEPPAGTDLSTTNMRYLPPELRLDPNNPVCKASGATEELDRYWGFRTGIGHYFTLPWRSVMNLDSAGYYVTTIPALLLAPLIFLLPIAWTRRGRWLRWLTAGSLFIVFQWMFLANGIPWYGIGMFLGLAIALEALIAYAPDKRVRIAAGVLIAFSLIIALGMRYWQFEMQRTLLEYPIGKINATALAERTIPWYDDIRAVVMERHETMPERPYLYRMGTFIPYFIPKNLEVIGIADHQLDVFNCLYQERNPKLTTDRLKALGFNSMVFDTNTATIERDPQGSLHKKVQLFIDYVNNPESGLRVLVSDLSAGIAFIEIP